MLGHIGRYAMPSHTFAYEGVLWGASKWTRHPELEGSYQARPSMSGEGASRIRQYHPIVSVSFLQYILRNTFQEIHFEKYIFRQYHPIVSVCHSPLGRRF